MAKLRRTCQHCEQTFEVWPSQVEHRGAKYCTRECYYAAGHIVLRCQQCGNIFTVYRSKKDRKHCSVECQHEAQKDRVMIQCMQCGGEIEIPKSRVGVVKFCSRECHTKWLSQHNVGENHPRWKSRVRLLCKWCEQEFEVLPYRADTARFCSRSCASSYRFANALYSIKDTRPEKQLAKLLKDNEIAFVPQYHLGGKFYDFFIPLADLLIEVDGTYWHAKGLLFDDMNEVQRHNRTNDAKKDKIASTHGFHLVRIWEDEISLQFHALFGN